LTWIRFQPYINDPFEKTKCSRKSSQFALIARFARRDVP